MNIKIRLYGVLLLLMVGLYVPVSYSQNPTYTCTLANGIQTSATVYEFDVYILNTSAVVFELYGAQVGLTYNSAVKNGGNLSAIYIASSCDAVIQSSGQYPNNPDVSVNGVIKIAPIIATPGRGAQISNVAPGTKLGRFRLTNTVAFAILSPNFAWNFSSVSPLYPSKMSATVPGGLPTGSGQIIVDITTQANHITTLDNGTLPIELSTFKSDVSGRQVNLNWTTKTEINSSKFEIQHALVNTKDTPVKWLSIGSVLASGSSNSPKNYSYIEKDLQSGKYQYRLKIIDKDGAYKYSDVIELNIALPKNFEVSQNYPNPFNPTTRINYSLPNDSRVTLEVYNITGERVGQIVNEEQSAGYYTVNFSSTSMNRNIASGVYIYKVNAVDKLTGKTFTSVKKMMLLK